MGHDGGLVRGKWRVRGGSGRVVVRAEGEGEE